MNDMTKNTGLRLRNALTDTKSARGVEAKTLHAIVHYARVVFSSHPQLAFPVEAAEEGVALMADMLENGFEASHGTLSHASQKLSNASETNGPETATAHSIIEFGREAIAPEEHFLAGARAEILLRPLDNMLATEADDNEFAVSKTLREHAGRAGLERLIYLALRGYWLAVTSDSEACRLLSPEDVSDGFGGYMAGEGFWKLGLSLTKEGEPVALKAHLQGKSRHDWPACQPEMAFCGPDVLDMPYLIEKIATWEVGELDEMIKRGQHEGPMTDLVRTDGGLCLRAMGQQLDPEGARMLMFSHAGDIEGSALSALCLRKDHALELAEAIRSFAREKKVATALQAGALRYGKPFD